MVKKGTWRKFGLIGLLFSVWLVLGAWSSFGTPESEPESMQQLLAKETSDSERSVQIINTQGEKIGMALLKNVPVGVKVSLEVSDLPPGTHGLHFHMTGLCTPPDFKSAGGHYNPEGKKHGFNNPEGPHAGDLPNLEIGANGKGKTEFITQLVTLVKGKSNSILKDGGTSLIIHQGTDDYQTDPAGNSGDRIACGAIK